ncbi:MAG: hypothetical protein R3250_05110 [Melioribacteraceae bacterium]|nr:hypothetical protein [Melioribacteraceae bacterium]
MKNIFDRYLSILEIERKEPSFNYLSQLLTAHLYKIPFENISKVYYYSVKGLKYIPDSDQYISGIGNCEEISFIHNDFLKADMVFTFNSLIKAH